MEILESGYPIGIIAAQSISQPLTQNTLSSFHRAGSLNEITENIPRFKELTYLINNNETSFCNIVFKKNMKFRDINNFLIYKEFKDIITNITIFNTNEYKKEYWLNNIDLNEYSNIIEINLKKKFQYNFFNIKKILYKFDKKYNERIIISPEHISKIIILFNNEKDDYINNIPNIENTYICGIENIIDVVKVKNNIVLIKGTNLKKILSSRFITYEKTKSNNIIDTYNVLGIEAARNILIEELVKIINIKSQYIKILADCMTLKGILIPVNSKGNRIINKSFLDNISYENLLYTLKKRIPYNVTNNINNITESIIVGKKPKLGTGMFSFLKVPVINLIYFEFFKNKNLIFCNNKLLFEKKNNMLIDFIEKKNIIKKSNIGYLIKNEDNLKIQKRLYTILNVYIKNNINTYFDTEKNLNIEIIEPKFINDIYDTNIYYEIVIGFNIFEIEIVDKNKYNISLINNKIIFQSSKKSIKIKLDKKLTINSSPMNIIIKIKNLSKRTNRINVIKN